MFYRHEDQSTSFYEKTLFNFLTVTVTSSSYRNLTIIYHSLRVQCCKYSLFYSVIETGTIMGSSVKKSVTLLYTDTFGLPTQSGGRKNLPLFNQGAIPTIIT